MANRADELERAAARVANRRVAEGLPAKDSVAAGLQIGRGPLIPTKWLWIIALTSGLVVLGLGLWVLAGISPSHIMIGAIIIFWIVGPSWSRGKK